MAYDPYGQIPSDQSQVGVGDLAGQALNPINWYMWRYQYDPRVWSIRKGLQLPFGEAIRNRGIGASFTRAGRLGKLVGNKRMGPIKATKDLFGGEFFLGEKMFQNIGAQIGAQRSLRKGLRLNVTEKLAKTNMTRAQQYRLSKVVGDSLEGVLDNAGSLSNLTQKQINDRLLDMDAKFFKQMGASSDDFFNMVRKGAFSTDDVARVTKAAGAEKFLGKLSTTNFKRFARYGARGVLTAGKVVAGVGAVMGMWDMAKMIGEPVGRYLVENTNRLAQAYQDRYAPELGGKIALSYMTGSAATERQRAIQAISRSYMNGRSAIGNEAQYLHS